MGPLATLAQIEHIETQVALAKEQGGTVLSGGQQPKTPDQGWFYEPTIIACGPEDDHCRYRAVRAGAERAAL